jgi:hypothetical protein
MVTKTFISQEARAAVTAIAERIDEGAFRLSILDGKVVVQNILII